VWVGGRSVKCGAGWRPGSATHSEKGEREKDGKRARAIEREKEKKRERDKEGKRHWELKGNNEVRKASIGCKSTIVFRLRRNLEWLHSWPSIGSVPSSLYGHCQWWFVCSILLPFQCLISHSNVWTLRLDNFLSSCDAEISSSTDAVLVGSIHPSRSYSNFLTFFLTVSKLLLIGVDSCRLKHKPKVTRQSMMHAYVTTGPMYSPRVIGTPQMVYHRFPI